MSATAALKNIITVSHQIFQVMLCPKFANTFWHDAIQRIAV